MQYTGTQMRKELQLVMEALERLDERFLKTEDPTIVIGKVIEGLGLHLSNLKILYDSGANDRNGIVPQCLTELRQISELVSEAYAVISTPTSPEDANRSM